MRRSFSKKEELREELVLDRTFEVVNLRECLKFLRDDKAQRALDMMEIRLDGAVISIAQHLDECKASLKEPIECELKKLSLYRQGSPGRSASWLDGCDSTTRDRLLGMKAQADEILGKYRGQGT